MEKQIEKILRSVVYKDGDIYVFYSLKSLKGAIKTIASLYEGWMSPEFLIWREMEFDGELDYDASLRNKEPIYTDFSRGHKSVTLPDLFKYWKDEVEGK